MDLRATEIVPVVGMSPVVDVANVSFTWPEAGGARRFGISVEALSLSPGSRTLLLGPSGSGKSTLLSLLGGIITPRSGTIRILNADFSQLSNAGRGRFRAEHIGVLFQMFNLLPYGSVLDNVLSPLSFARIRRERARDDGNGSEVNAAKRIKPGQETSLGTPCMLAAVCPELFVSNVLGLCRYISCAVTGLHPRCNLPQIATHSVNHRQD